MGVFLVGMAVLQAWPGRGFWQGSAPGKSPGDAHRHGAAPWPRRASPVCSRPWSGPSGGSTPRTGGGSTSWWWSSWRPRVGVLHGRRRDWCGRRCTWRSYCASPTGSSSRTSGSSGASAPTPTACCPWRSCSSRDTWPSPGYRWGSPVAVAGRRAPPRFGSPPWCGRGRGGTGWLPGYLTRVLAAIAAIAVVLVGAVPMAAASVNPTRTRSWPWRWTGHPNTVDLPAPAFHLVDQAGRPVSLSDLRGKTVALTFLDPVCTSDCPLIAQEFRDANSLLGADSRQGGVRGRGGQPDLPGDGVHQRVRPARGPRAHAQLAVPHRVAPGSRPGLGRTTASRPTSPRRAP